MRVLFISANRAEINMRAMPVGMMCVAAAVKNAGHQVRILDLMSAGKPFELLAAAVNEFQPEVIGISLRNIDDQNMRSPRLLLEDDNRVIEVCKSLSKAPIVLGGAGYSIFPKAALDQSGADLGIQGEGESAFPKLLARLEKRKSLSGIPGLYVKGKGPQAERKFEKDLDRLALPGPEFFPTEPIDSQGLWFPVQTRRGCPNACSYCSTAAIAGNKTRKRSPLAVVKWMARLKQKGFQRFYFVDNTFNIPRGYAQKLCEELSRASIAVDWRCIIYPLKLEEPLVAAMARAGCKEVSVGFESGSERILKIMNKRFRPGDVRHACKLLGDHGIRRMGFLLLGGPGETRESVEESLHFADSLGLEFLKITIGIRIYPDTPLAGQAMKEGIITPHDDLLYPRFYMAPGLEGWLRETVAKWAADRPNWVVDR